MTTMDATFLTNTFQPVLDLHLRAYLDAAEILADDATGGNRRTVAKEVAEKYGDRTDFGRRVVDALVREARPKDENGQPLPNSEPDVSLLFHLMNSFDKALKDHEATKAVDSFVAGRVAELKKNVDPERSRASDAEKQAARETMLNAYSGIESVKNLVNASRIQFGDEAVDNFLAQIPDTITKPRKPSGPTGPRLRNGNNPKAKYEFFDGTNKVGDQLSKVAGVLGAELQSIKDNIAAEHVPPVDGEDDSLYEERVKAWFNAAPNSFGFTVNGEKGETRIRAVVTSSIEDTDNGDEDDDAE